MRPVIVLALPLIVLAACAPQVPASNYQPPATQTGPLDAPLSLPSSPSLSDEQSFSAVSARETIETDAARREAQAAAYQVVQPTQLPARTQDAGPNIVDFALRTTNAVGQAIYQRGYTRPSRFQSSCESYASDDAAQRAFLAGGGPESNVGGMDPDGDGFACAWDPTPFRAAANAARPVQAATLVQVAPLPAQD